MMGARIAQKSHLLEEVTLSKGLGNLVAVLVLTLALAATPRGIRGQQDSVVAPAVRDTTCVDTTDTTRAAERQKVRRRHSMDHNEVAAPRVDNIPLEGTDKGFIPIPGTASDSLPVCPVKKKVSHDSAG
jgi:hypothetical protein